jgi:hypothetical protein
MRANDAASIEVDMQKSTYFFGILIVSFAFSEGQAQERKPTQLVSGNTAEQGSDGTIPSMEPSVGSNDLNFSKGCASKARKVQRDIRASIDGGTRCDAAPGSAD